MADIFLGMDRGEDRTDIVEQGASPTKDVEITIDDAVNMTRKDIVLMLEHMIAHVKEMATLNEV